MAYVSSATAFHGYILAFAHRSASAVSRRHTPMRVFVVGATGYIGRVVAQRLLSAGHIVSGLARTEQAAQALKTHQIVPEAGNIDAPEQVAAIAAQADATIYVAAAATFALDQQAVSAILAHYHDSGKRFIFTSGSAVFADAAGGEPSNRVFTEAEPPTQAMMGERVDIEQQVVAAHTSGVRAVVVRPPLVYGRGGSIQVPLLIDIARQTGIARYIGRGENRWSTAHVDDLADMYALVLQHDLSGEIFHAASDEVRMRDLADAVGRLLHLGPAVSWSMEEAKTWGAFVAGLGSNSRISGEKARRMLGWQPHRISVLADVEFGSYQ